MLCSELIHALATQVKAEGDTEVMLVSTMNGHHFPINSLIVGEYSQSGPAFLIEADDASKDQPKG